MADPKKDDFLDDIEAAEAEEQAGLSEEIDDIAMEIDALRAERDDYKDKFMRALADAENARKRSDKDRREAENYGGSKLARDMLPVFDNMKRAVESATEEQKALMRQNRYVFYTGARDQNRRETRSIFSQYKNEGIENVLLIDDRNATHQTPRGPELIEAIRFLDGEAEAE